MTAWGRGDNILEDGNMLCVTQRMWVKPWGEDSELQQAVVSPRQGG